MLSTGTKAFYLSAVNALHGDIGILNSDDIFVIFSKSGESDELLNLVPYVRNKGASLVSVTCTETSRLSKACDLHVTLPMERELCPYNLAPTTSASLQLLFGDVLATALMKAKNFSLDEYAKNHPSGRIGKRIIVKVRDLMITDEALPLCKENDKLIDVLDELSVKRCGCLIVVDNDGKLKGIFTDGDLRRSLHSKGPDFRENFIKDLMTHSAKSIGADVLAWEAMKVMEADQKHPVTVLPVLEEEKVVGIIKMHDIIQSGI
jgi:arabinose-5-phosphate isomerase